MNNASYHSVREKGTTAPTSNSLKGDIINWLEKNNVPFDKKSKKPELYEIIKSKKQPPVYKVHVDEFLKRKGHEVLRLPPYHCEFNPIELIWGDLKGYIGRENSTFKLNDVKHLIQKGLSQIDKLKWLNACNHVKNNIELKCWKEDGIRGEISKVVINLEFDNESDSESNDDDSSDGDETEDYEWP
jgi:transposase